VSVRHEFEGGKAQDVWWNLLRGLPIAEHDKSQDKGESLVHMKVPWASRGKKGGAAEALTAPV